MPTLLIEILHGISIEGSLPDAVLETAYTAPLRARNAVLPLRWEKVGGAWPPSGDWDIDELTGVVSGDADDAGPYSVTIMCTDGAGDFAQRTFKWRVAAAPLVLAGDMPDAQVGDSADYAYTVTGGRGVKTVTVVVGALPPGRTISAVGVVTGTYSAGGSYAWTLRCVDEDLAEAFLPDSAVVAYETLAVGGAWAGVDVGQPLGGSPRAISGGLAPYSIDPLPISGTRPSGVAFSVSGSNLVAAGNTTTAGSYAWTDRLRSADGQYVDLAASTAIVEIFGKLWRVLISANNGDVNYTGIGDLEMYATPGGANQCFGGTPLASSQIDGGPGAAAAAFDGNKTAPNNGWVTLSGRAIPSWLRYEFGSRVAIRQIGVWRQWNQQTRLPRDFVLQRSDDGVNWTTVLTVTGASAWANGVPNIYTVT